MDIVINGYTLPFEFSVFHGQRESSVMQRSWYDTLVMSIKMFCRAYTVLCCMGCYKIIVNLLEVDRWRNGLWWGSRLRFSENCGVVRVKWWGGCERIECGTMRSRVSSISESPVDRFDKDHGKVVVLICRNLLKLLSSLSIIEFNGDEWPFNVDELTIKQ